MWFDVSRVSVRPWGLTGINMHCGMIGGLTNPPDPPQRVGEGKRTARGTSMRTLGRMVGSTSVSHSPAYTIRPLFTTRWFITCRCLDRRKDPVSCQVQGPVSQRMSLASKFGTEPLLAELRLNVWTPGTNGKADKPNQILRSIYPHAFWILQQQPRL